MKPNKTFSLIICCIFSLLANNFIYAAQNYNLLHYAYNNKTSTIDQEKNTQNPQLSGHVENGIRIVEVKAFRYGYNPDPIIVKEGEKVRLLLTSADVTHGFGIADLGINIKIPAKKTTVFEFIPKHAGTYHIHCTVYCGIGHGNMHGTLVIIK